MDTRRVRTPVLVIYYNRYLTNNDCALFVKRVARRYSCGTLERLRHRRRPHDAPRRRVRPEPAGRLRSERRARPGPRRSRPRRAQHRRKRHPRIVVPRRQPRRSAKRLCRVVNLNDERRHAEAARLATDLIRSSPLDRRSLVPARHRPLSPGPIRCGDSRLPSGARNQSISLHRGGGNGTMLPVARQPRRRA